MRTPLILGHRGCRGGNNPPENSLASFREALDQGADGFELDVRRTANGELLVFHDTTLTRMTGHEGDIATLTPERRRSLYLLDHRPLRGEPQLIPTLDEVLDLAESYRNNTGKRLIINIELCGGNGVANAVANLVHRRVEQGWQPNDFLISSFDMDSLRTVKQRNLGVQIGGLFDTADDLPDITTDLLTRRLMEHEDIKFDTVNLVVSSLTEKAATIIRAQGAQPVAWTYNEPHTEENRAFMTETVRANALPILITDYPREMRTALAQKAGHPGVEITAIRPVPPAVAAPLR